MSRPLLKMVKQSLPLWELMLLCQAFGGEHPAAYSYRHGGQDFLRTARASARSAFLAKRRS